MPHPAAPAGFLAASLALLLLPGPAVLLVVGRSLAGGRRAALGTVAGVAGGDLAQALAAVAGLSALVASSATAFDVVRIAGAAYLTALGIGHLRSGEDPEAPEGRPRGATLDAFTVGALNPKTAVVFLAFLPQFVDPSGSAALQTLVLGVLFVALGVLTKPGVCAVCGLGGRALRGARAALAPPRRGRRPADRARHPHRGRRRAPPVSAGRASGPEPAGRDPGIPPPVPPTRSAPRRRAASRCPSRPAPP